MNAPADRMENPPAAAYDAGGVWALVVCLCGVALAAGLGALAAGSGWRAQLAETNFQSNMIRLADYRHGPRPHAVLIGTSLSGRLLPGYFREAGMEVANLGLDGAMVVTGMEIALSRPDPALVWLVETRTLGQEAGANDAQLLAALDDFSFWLGARFPALQASARPSSILYTRMKAAKDRRTGGRPGAAPASPGTSAPVASPVDTSFPPATERVLAQARAAGVRVIFVHLPDGRRVADSQPPAHAIAAAEARGFGWLDVPKLMSEAGVETAYTDGLHLAAPAAANAARLIAQELRSDAGRP